MLFGFVFAGTKEYEGHSCLMIVTVSGTCATTMVPAPVFVLLGVPVHPPFALLKSVTVKVKADDPPGVAAVVPIVTLRVPDTEGAMLTQVELTKETPAAPPLSAVAPK
jgi:hypothetical protein